MPKTSSDHLLKQQIESLEKEVRLLKKNEAGLKMDQNRFQAIFNSMHDIYFEVDLKGNFIHFNPALCEVFGYTSEELVGKNNRDYTIPDTAKRMYQVFNKIFTTGEPSNINDYQIITKAGEVRYLELSAYLIKDDDGNPIGFRGVGRDVSDRIEISKKLRENEDWVKKLSEASFSAIFIHSQGRILDCNQEMIRVTGYDYDELIDMDGLKLCAPESRKAVMKAMRSNDENVYDVVVLKKDGTRIHVEVYGKNILYHGVKARVTEFRDISACKKTEEALRKSRVRYRQLYKDAHRAEELYQSLLNSSADAILLTDIDFKAQFINPAFTNIFGWNLSEMAVDQLHYIPKPLKQSFAELMKKVMDLDHPIHGFETQRYTKDGRLLDVSISASRYLDHAGDAAGILLIFRDISDAKRYQWHMEQAQRMESLGTLAGGVAHDFNNLLMGIQGRLSLLMLNKDDSDSEFKHLKEIEDYIIRAADLTQQMLGIARSGKYEVKSTDIKNLVKTQNRMFGRTRKEILIYEEFDENLFTAEVDQRQIDQVLLNMYVNASHAMPDGGDLYIRVSNEMLDKELTAPHNVEPGKYVKISITDTGVGMDRAILKRIFEPFFSTKQRGRGTGLGLASAYGIIKNHEGLITVYSEKDKGTTFNIFLPASAAEAEEEHILNTEVLEGTGTILLVDDEEMIISVADEMIQALGYNVITARDGHEALDIYRDKKDQIDMVILDLIMPGMGGGETFDQLKSLNPDVKVLLSSGYSIDGQASTILKRGCRGFIQKPFSLQALSQKISTTIVAEGSA
ncbi:MAG: PAS domain S-box protein [Desulfobacteraceae bacterium]|jgi:two-component system cell cycle sensor histidine kinase/response regulator CckA|nr:PAS domain S-box protein [Desulfobacteraceae bacterium]